RLNRRKPAAPGKSGAASQTVRTGTRPVATKSVISHCQEKLLNVATVSQPYPKPTQVDEENIHRRSREHSFRNSANWLRNFGRRSAPLGFIARGGRSEKHQATV